MEKFKHLLAIWSKMSTQLFVRDRILKILQYGCQMLLGFYATKMTNENIECLRALKYTTSTSRKAFWLLKSVNHFSFLVDMVESYDYAADIGFVNFLDVIEQAALVLYYWYENLVFFSRTKVVTYSEDTVDWWGNSIWFLEDFVCFIAQLIRTFVRFRTLIDKKKSLGVSSIDISMADIQEAKTDSTQKCPLDCSLNGGRLPVDNLAACNHHHDIQALKVELMDLKYQFRDSVLRLVIVSSNFIDLFLLIM